MSNLKNLLLRIKTVKSTQKITKVMKMIAASKLKSAQKELNLSNNFEKTILESISRVECKEVFPTPNSEADKIELIIIITSNRGLCGGYNYNIIKLFTQYVKDRKDFKVFFIGSKAYDLLYKQYSEHILGMVKNEKLSFTKTKKILDDLLKENFSLGTVFYTHFKNSFSLIPKKERFIPFLTYDEYLENFKGGVECKTEPERSLLVPSMIKSYAYAHLYRMIKDSVASEHMNRMIAMDNASNNAVEVIDNLNLIYNRSRQAKVTNELIEIISGMEAPLGG